MSKHKEVELYEAFFPSCQGEGSSHATIPPTKVDTTPLTCGTCEDDVAKCTCHDNDSLGG